MDLYIGIFAHNRIQTAYLVNHVEIMLCPTLNLPILLLNVIVRPLCEKVTYSHVLPASGKLSIYDIYRVPTKYPTAAFLDR